jgi:hypothetical protein
VFGRGTTPGEVASYLVHELVTSGRARRTGDVAGTGRVPA